MCGIGVENLAPDSGERNLDAVVPIDLGREIDHHQAAIMGLGAPCATKRRHCGRHRASTSHSKPAASQSSSCSAGKVAVEPVEIAHQRLNAGMPRAVEQVPVERMVMPPFVFLAELVAHEQQLLAGMTEHEAVIGAQIGEALPFVAGHAAEDRALAVHDLVMRERQDEVLGERVVQTEQDLAVMVLAVDRILADVSSVSCIQPMFHL